MEGERWALKLKLTDKGPWQDIHIHTASSPEAWRMLGAYLRYHDIVDWYAAMAYRLDI